MSFGHDRKILMTMICRLIAAAAMAILNTSAEALTMQECRDQSKADHARGVRTPWDIYQVKVCGIDTKASPPATKPATR
jgi:hypothetical protein